VLNNIFPIYTKDEAIVTVGMIFLYFFPNQKYIGFSKPLLLLLLRFLRSSVSGKSKLSVYIFHFYTSCYTAFSYYTFYLNRIEVRFSHKRFPQIVICCVYQLRTIHFINQMRQISFVCVNINSFVV